MKPSFTEKFMSIQLLLVTLFVSISMNGFASELSQEPAEAFSVDALARSAYTDHVVAFDEVFSLLPVKSMVEFGLGRSTKFFLDRCPMVASLELTTYCTASLSFSWYKQCVDAFIDATDHWRPSLRFCSPLMNLLTGDGKGGVPSKEQEALFIKEISSICAQGLLLAGEECSLAFVDSGTAGRVDIVNALFERKVPIVVAHDTRSPFYHWERLQVPKHYMAIEFPVRERITFWFDTERFDQTVFDELHKAKERVGEKIRTIYGG